MISKKNINIVNGTAKAPSIIIAGRKFVLPYDMKPILTGMYAIMKNINILKYTQALAFLGSISFNSGVVFLPPHMNTSSNSSSVCLLKVFLNKSLKVT